MSPGRVQHSRGLASVPHGILLLFLAGLANALLSLRQAAFRPSLGITTLALVISLVLAIGLVMRREWARTSTVFLSGAALLVNLLDILLILADVGAVSLPFAALGHGVLLVREVMRIVVNSGLFPSDVHFLGSLTPNLSLAVESVYLFAVIRYLRNRLTKLHFANGGDLAGHK